MVMTNQTVNTKFADDGLEDMLMQCDDQALAVVASWGHLQSSLQWSPRLSRWLNDAVNCEHARRQMRATSFPSLDIVNGWSNREVVGALGLACLWNDAAVDGLTGQFSRKLRNAVIAVVTDRLLNADDPNKLTEGESCNS